MLYAGVAVVSLVATGTTLHGVVLVPSIATTFPLTAIPTTVVAVSLILRFCQIPQAGLDILLWLTPLKIRYGI